MTAALGSTIRHILAPQSSRFYLSASDPCVAPNRSESSYKPDATAVVAFVQRSSGKSTIPIQSVQCADPTVLSADLARSFESSGTTSRAVPDACIWVPDDDTLPCCSVDVPRPDAHLPRCTRTHDL